MCEREGEEHEKTEREREGGERERRGILPPTPSPHSSLLPLQKERGREKYRERERKGIKKGVGLKRDKKGEPKCVIEKGLKRERERRKGGKKNRLLPSLTLCIKGWKRIKPDKRGRGKEDRHMTGEKTCKKGNKRG
jgi:hypothetical protein